MAYALLTCEIKAATISGWQSSARCLEGYLAVWHGIPVRAFAPIYRYQMALLAFCQFSRGNSFGDTAHTASTLLSNFCEGASEDQGEPRLLGECPCRVRGVPAADDRRCKRCACLLRAAWESGPDDLAPPPRPWAGRASSFSRMRVAMHTRGMSACQHAAAGQGSPMRSEPVICKRQGKANHYDLADLSFPRACGHQRG